MQVNFSNSDDVGAALEVLMLRATVAFALRTSWRVLPLLELCRSRNTDLPERTAYHNALGTVAGFATGRRFVALGPEHRPFEKEQLSISRQLADDVLATAPDSFDGSHSSCDPADIGRAAAFVVYASSKAAASGFSAMFDTAMSEDCCRAALNHATRSLVYGFRAALAASEGDSPFWTLDEFDRLSRYRREHEASWIEGAFRSDWNRLRQLRRGSWRELGHPIDPSERGPLGELWPDGTPAWFVIGQRGSGRVRDLQIGLVPSGASDDVRAHEQKRLASGRPDFLVWNMKDCCGAIEDVLQAISAIRSLYRDEQESTPALAVIGCDLSDEEYELVTGAGAVVYTHKHADPSLYCETADDFRLLLERNSLPAVQVDDLLPADRFSNSGRLTSAAGIESTNHLFDEDDTRLVSRDDYQALIKALRPRASE